MTFYEKVESGPRTNHSRIYIDLTQYLDSGFLADRTQVTVDRGMSCSFVRLSVRLLRMWLNGTRLGLSCY